MDTLYLRNVYDALTPFAREELITSLNIENPERCSDMELCMRFGYQGNNSMIRFLFNKTLNPLYTLADGLNVFEYHFPKSTFDAFNKITVLNDYYNIKLNEYNVKNGFMYIPACHQFAEYRKITIYSYEPHIDIQFDAVLMLDNYERNKLSMGIIYDLDNNIIYSGGVIGVCL